MIHVMYLLVILTCADDYLYKSRCNGSWVSVENLLCIVGIWYCDQIISCHNCGHWEFHDSRNVFASYSNMCRYDYMYKSRCNGSWVNFKNLLCIVVIYILRVPACKVLYLFFAGIIGNKSWSALSHTGCDWYGQALLQQSCNNYDCVIHQAGGNQDVIVKFIQLTLLCHVCTSHYRHLSICQNHS